MGLLTEPLSIELLEGRMLLAVGSVGGGDLNYVAADGETNDVVLSPGDVFSIQDAPDVQQIGRGCKVSDYLRGLSFGIGFDISIEIIKPVSISFDVGFGFPLIPRRLPDGLICPAPSLNLDDVPSSGVTLGDIVKESVGDTIGSQVHGVSSVVAGAEVTQDETVFYQVEASNGRVDEYKLFQVIADADEAFDESESNDTPFAPQVIEVESTSGDPHALIIGEGALVQGEFADDSDIDFYAFESDTDGAQFVQEGDTFVVILDNDPDDDGRFASTEVQLLFKDGLAGEPQQLGVATTFGEQTAVGAVTIPSDGILLVSLADKGFGDDTDYQFVLAKANTDAPEDEAATTTIMETATPSSAITDGGTVTSTIDVDFAPTDVKQATVKLNLDHDEGDDLEVVLVAPDDTEVKLFSAGDISGSGNMDVTFEDGAVSLSCTLDCSGTFQPEENLSAFIGHAVAGTWKLRITDTDANGNAGTLNDWTLELEAADPKVLATDEFGSGQLPSEFDVDTFEVSDSAITSTDNLLVFAFVDTQDTDAVAVDDNDSKLRVLAADGVETLGEDDDSGPAVLSEGEENESPVVDFDRFVKTLGDADVDIDALSSPLDGVEVVVKDGNDRVDASKLSMATGSAITVNAGSGDDLILAAGGTNVVALGDGADTIRLNPIFDSTIELTPSSDIDGDALLVDQDAGDDTIVVIMDDDDLVIEINGRVARVPDITSAVDDGTIDALLIQPGDKNDTIIIDSSGGPIVFPEGITIDTGDGQDRIILRGGEAAAATYSAGAEHGNGRIETTFPGNDNPQVIRFENLDPVLDVISDAVTVDGDVGYTINASQLSDAINFGDGPVSTDPETNASIVPVRVTLTNEATLDLSNNQRLAVNALEGDDTINVNVNNADTGLLSLTINGNDPTAASDTVIINGTTGGNTMRVDSLGPDSAAVIGAQPMPVIVHTAERLILNGQNGDDDLTVTTPPGRDEIVLNDGPLADRGRIAVRGSDGDSRLPIEFLNLGVAGSLTFDDADQARVDELVYNAGDTANTRADFLVDPSGRIQLRSPSSPAPEQEMVDVMTPSIDVLRLNSLDGDDQFTVTGPVPFSAMFLGGGEPGGSDVADLTGDATAFSVNLGGPNPTLTGGGLGAVDVTGVEIVNLRNGAGDITVGATDDPNAIVVTPSGSDTASIRVDHLAPVLNTNNTGNLTVDGGDGGDTLTVNGTNVGETITVDGPSGLVTVAGLRAVNLTTIEALTVESHEGDDVIDVTPQSGLSILVDGGERSGQTSGDQLNVNALGNHVSVEPGAEGDDGVILVGADRHVGFTSIEAASVTNSSSATILGTSGADAMTVIARDDTTHAGADGIEDFTTAVNDGPEVLFLNTSTLTVDARGGSDEIAVQAPAPNGGVWDVDLTVHGGLPTASDQVIFGTPGNNTAAYSPTGVDSGALAIVDLNSTSTFDDIEHLTYDGEGGDDQVTIQTPASSDSVVTITPGSTVDAADVQVDSLLPFRFVSLGGGGEAVLDDPDAADRDTLVYHGTAASDTFRVPHPTATAPSIGLNRQIPVRTGNVEEYQLRSLGGDDTFNVIPQTGVDLLAEGDEPGSSDALNFARDTTGDATVVVDLDSDVLDPNLVQTMVQPGRGVVQLAGIEHVHIDANTADLYLSGTRYEDSFSYTPRGPDSGRFSAQDLATVYDFEEVPQGTHAFTITGGSVGFADQVIFHGTAGSDLVRVDGPNREVQLDVLGFGFPPVALSTWRDVTLDDASSAFGTPGIIEAVSVNGHDGQDTFHVVPAAPVGNGLFVDVQGGSPQASDALVITDFDQDRNPVPLAPSDFVVVGKSREEDAGQVIVFSASARRPGISYQDVEVISPNMATDDRNTDEPNLLIVGPDQYEENEFRATAAFLGSGEVINVENLSILPNAFEHLGVPADQDYFRVVAGQTGTLDFQVYFRMFDPNRLPAAGNLHIEVLDATGDVVGGTGAFGTQDATADARVRIPAISGQTYYLHVFGADADVVNGYDVTVLNEPPPVPYDIELNDLPVGDPPPVNSDTGRSHFDNVTRDNTPLIRFRVDDAIFLHDLPANPDDDTPADEVIPIPFNLSRDPANTDAGYRVAVYVEGPPQEPKLPQRLVGFATQFVEGVYEFDFGDIDDLGTSYVLTDGSQFISSRVQMIDPAHPAQTGFGQRSTSLEIVVDTMVPPVQFGDLDGVEDGLLPDSDSTIWSFPELSVDRVTSDTTPSFFGVAEADAIVRLYVVTDDHGTPVPEDDDVVQIGQTVATPIDGTNQFPNGEWSITSTIDLNDPGLGLAMDGVRIIRVTAEDPAGNVNIVGDDIGDAGQEVTIFIDTQGPRITNVTRGLVSTDNVFSFDGVTNLFDPKPTVDSPAELGVDGPDPLIHSIVIYFQDDPPRSAADPNFLYDALYQALAAEEGNYQVTGDHNGNITILEAIPTLVDADGVVLDPQANLDGQPASMRVELVFAAPLPDDRLTLWVSDSLADPAGNTLDGESDARSPFDGNDVPEPTPPVFPTGDGEHGGEFIARFTVDSRPEIGTAAFGTSYIDINGNFVFDPEGKDRDQTNRDIVFAFGLRNDRVFAGNFAPDDARVASGFDKLASYGVQDDGPMAWHWRFDFDHDGVIDLDVVSGEQTAGDPVAGDFAPNHPGDEIGLFNGNHWFLDTSGNNNIGDPDDADLQGDMRGLPIVGDFDGDGLDDLATWDPGAAALRLNGEFLFDLAYNGLTGDADRVIEFDLTGVFERPVAADMNEDGIDDLGLYVTRREGVTPEESGEWFFLISDDPTPTPGEVTALDHPFTPIPFGTDIFAQYGDEQALPIVGNFDPPVQVTGETLASTVLVGRQPGDADENGRFDQIDVVVTLQAGKYLSPNTATWREGDWNGDGLFNQLDIVAALQTGNYLQGDYEALGHDSASTSKAIDAAFAELGR